MEAHGEDLRAQSGDEKLAAQIKADYRKAGLNPAQRALCEFAEKLTFHPSSMKTSDVDHLRSVGLEDTAILDAVQVIAYFNYINRVADALGVDPEK
ncbi:MAG TPA: peroxidase-related enzyme [Acidobacteriota bacterium]